MQSGSDFRAALGKWADKVGEQADGLARQVCQEMGYRVVLATPVDTGFLRGMWQPTIGDVASFAPKAVNMAAGPDVSLVCAGIKAGDVFNMANGTAYARRLEYGFVGKDSLGRTYNQVGRYYVRDTVAKFREVVDEAAAGMGLK